MTHRTVVIASAAALALLLFPLAALASPTSQPTRAARPSGSPHAHARAGGGGGWAIQTSPNPAGSGTNELDGIACWSETLCTAVGDYFNSSGVQVTLAEGWNGTKWAIEATANPKGATLSGLSAVACPSQTDCVAVGDYQVASGAQRTLVEDWNGTSWAIQTAPHPSRSSQLSGVSCWATNGCIAVGVDAPMAVGATLAEVWNGTSWATQTTPTEPSGAQLESVSCTGPKTCSAVGFYGTSTGATLTLAERWDGTSWTIETTPNPSSTMGFNELLGVSCASAVVCSGVGAYDTASGAADTLAVQRSATGWTQPPSQSPSAKSNFLIGVSCQSTANCTATGETENGSSVFVTLAEHWNGSGWTVQATPNPSGSTFNVLNAVSCPSKTACFAAGKYTASGGSILTLVERD